MHTFDGPMFTPNEKNGRVVSGKDPIRIRRSRRLLQKTKLNKFTSKELVVLFDDDEEPYIETHIEPESQL